MIVSVESRPEFVDTLESIRFLSPEEKSMVLRGNIFFVVNSVTEWNRAHEGLRYLEDIPPTMQLWEREIDEACEMQSLHKKLKEVPLIGEWYRDTWAQERWKVAAELADVAIFAIGVLEEKGWDREKIALAFASYVNPWQGADKEVDKLIRSLKISEALCEDIGMDIYEAIAYKVTLNEQHRPRSLDPKWQNGLFACRMRRSIGKDDSQMPFLSQSLLGETVLEKHVQGSPFSSNGRSVMIPFIAAVAEKAVLPVIDGNEYDGLYKYN